MAKRSAVKLEEPVSFRDWVVARQNSTGDRRKGERTRDRIRLATIELLNEVGYRDLKVSSICNRANITPPVLYNYFESKETLVHSVLLEFLQEYTGRIESRGGGRTPYQAMFEANLLWIRSARANAGLMKCLLQFSEERAEFAQLFAQESNRWNQRITQSIVHRFPDAKSNVDEIHFVVHALSGMTDELTRRLFATDEQHLGRLVGRVAPTDAVLAGLLTSVWYRALYAADPPSTEARPLAPLLVDAEAKSRKSGRSRPRSSAKAVS